mmetsp:Transcript_271/g.982  ORF Transcript_271/g.982 Transcript_271/m.982 type:complete len:242 (+) Transcript_271:1336-2061(+)
MDPFRLARGVHAARRLRHGKRARVQRRPPPAADDVVAEVDEGSHGGGAAVADDRGYDRVHGVRVPRRAGGAEQRGDARVGVHRVHHETRTRRLAVHAAAVAAKVRVVLVHVHVRRFGGRVSREFAVRVIRRVGALRHRRRERNLTREQVPVRVAHRDDVPRGRIRRTWHGVPGGDDARGRGGPSERGARGRRVEANLLQSLQVSGIPGSAGRVPVAVGAPRAAGGRWGRIARRVEGDAEVE